MASNGILLSNQGPPAYPSAGRIVLPFDTPAGLDMLFVKAQLCVFTRFARRASHWYGPTLLREEIELLLASVVPLSAHSAEPEKYLGTIFDGSSTTG